MLSAAALLGAVVNEGHLLISCMGRNMATAGKVLPVPALPCIRVR